MKVVILVLSKYASAKMQGGLRANSGSAESPDFNSRRRKVINADLRKKVVDALAQEREPRNK